VRALWRAGGGAVSETCDVCGARMGVRPVLKDVRNGFAASRHTRPTIKKHVHCKPLQLVVTTRVEGSTSLTGGKPAALGESFVGQEWRICADCCEGKTLATVFAVLLDRKLEEGA